MNNVGLKNVKEKDVVCSLYNAAIKMLVQTDSVQKAYFTLPKYVRNGLSETR